jgi:hypothetical protein
MRLFFAVLVCTLSLPVHAAGLLSEQEATRKAADFLRGRDFGGSYYDIVSHIKRSELVKKGWSHCGVVTTPLWAFHVQNPYDGWLYLDATSGEKLCSSIPFHR